MAEDETPTPSGVHVHGNVFGGGNLATVGGSVTVNMGGGTVDKDVYGGGALANTNTNNWNFEGEGYEVVSVTADVTVVTGLYIESNGVYTEITDENQKADEHTVYYQKIGTWASGMYNTTTGTTYTTVVNLFGGTINGDAYGGGLGQLGNNPVAAMVYGNVFLNLGNETEDEDKRSATAFKITYADTGDKDEDNNPIKVVNSGRVFGCNNLNGTPKGSVTVTVNKTVIGKDADGNDLERTEITRDSQTKKVTSVATPHKYEVAAVYGGGNLANYVPKDGVVKVIINSCDVSVEQVYGGGNAAEVPSTDVLVKGAHEIEQVFGGGNGKDKYYLNNQWNENSGANVNGNANTLIKGGLVHEAYGGSNERGTITGNVTIDTGTGDLAACPPQVDKLVGAGKNADVNGNLIMILGCKDATKIPIVYGGADNANLNGNVELTITSGHFGQVFGGNNLGGVIRGHIYLNIEETSECEPITIDDLYLGGNQAAYSRYGYYVQTTAMEGENATGEYRPEETPVLTNDKLTFLPRTSATDSHKPVKTYDMAAKTWTVYAGTTEDPYPEYEEPVLNVISCTSIGRVFGGGLGEGAAMYADPTVNINMIPGYHATNNGLGEIGVGYTYTDETTSETVTVEGGVFGGGNQAAIIGNTTVNIGTETSVYVKSWTYNAEKKEYTGANQTVQGANIKSNVYGGGNLANVTGNTFVNICAKIGSGDSYAPVAEGTQKVTIGGNVFGGGKGIADNFYCNKAMVGEDGKGSPDNLGTNYHDGNTSVIIGNGTVGTLENGELKEGTGNVYGGGEVGRVEMNTTVTVGLPGEETSSPDIKGDVFGGGMGEKEHGYAGLVRGNPTVTIQANAKVEHSVYGGGEIASVARYKVPITDEDVTAAHNAGYPDAVKGRPYALKDVNSGFCTVTVQGNAVIGPDTPMKMYHEVNGAIPATDTPDDAGHVFGAGKGFMPENYDYDADEVGHKPRCRANDNSWTWFNDVDEYIAFIQTQALSSQTTVTIGDADDSNSKPFIKGSVYGGSENGLVQFDTHVYIIGGQIGCGKNANGQPHPDAIWDPDFEPDGTEDYECASWAYGKEEGSGDDKTTVYAPYDPFANASGNVDKYPKVPSQSEAKSTEGGRRVATDGHTYYGNVFGGGSGSVPYFDTKEGISKYLHSAGTVKGNTNVTISGGHILTSVYGGCEATNVMETANVTMTGGTIGVPRTDTQILAHPVTCNLYGAGKGDQRVFFNKDTNVNDAVVEVSGGRIYGSVFGGGEDGHIMRNSTVTISGADTKIGTKGTSYMDGNVFGGGRGFGGDALTAGNVGGAVTLNIENGYVLGSVYGGGRLASVGYGLYLTTEEGYGVMRADNEYDGSYTNPSTEAASTFFNKGRGKITINISGGTIGNDVANAEYGGNVFGGSMGSLTKQDGTINTQWDKFATAKMTTVNITGGTIKRSVYGGGELGTVTTDAIVTVSGGTIGKPKDGTTVYGGAVYGNVYGGGKGYVDPAGSNYITAGIIKGNTYVTIENGSITVGETPTTTTPTIYHNIYGGGAYGSVGEFTYDGTTGMPTARTSGGTANITITGGTIGTDGQNNGMVFGSSRGDVGAPGEIHDKLAWVYDTHVTIGETSGSTSTPLIKGSVYGSGENGHTFNDAEVVVHSGTIGIASGSAVDGLSGSDYPYRGNVYGSGCGTDKYYSYTPIPEGHTATDGEGDRYNPLAGIVQGNTAITIDGGHVVRNVYGGGAMGSVGTLTNDLDPTTHMVDDKYKNTNAESSFALSWPYKLEYAEGTGKATITISGSARIGNEGDDDGNVYGAARGAVKVGRNSDVTIDNQRYVEALLANVRETEVKVNYETTVTSTSGTSACITGSVFGGGEDGHVYEDAKIEITGGLIGHSVYGGGKGKSTFDGKLLYVTKPNSVTADDYDAEIHSWTAGRVFGNTEVLMSGGHVMRNIYGGGNLASVGKGNYAGGTDDYYPAGYGEKIGSALSDDTDFMGSGKAKVQITGQSIVGTPDNATEGTVVLSDGTTEVGFPTGNVFGSSRGQAAQDVGPRSPRYKYAPDFFLGYANETEVIIGTTGNASDYPRIYGSVYGGGRDGHVRRKTDVTINNGKIGYEFTAANQTTLGSTDASNVQWKERGNVFGSGSGLGSLVVNGTNTHGTSSGSVTDFTTITIKGGTICQDVYGGGALSSVGPPRLPVNRTDDPLKTQTLCQVNIEGGAVGTADGYSAGYGGNVFGAGRGGGLFSGENEESYATSGWTEVNMKNGTVNGNIYGGGKAGIVKCGVNVTMTDGEVKHDVYGGGALADTQTSNWDAAGDGYELITGLTAGASVVTGLYTKSGANYTEITTADTKAAANTYYYNKVGTWAQEKTSASNTTLVSLTGGIIGGDAYGGGLGEIGTTSNPVGNPAYVYGDVKVELNKSLGDDAKGCIVNRVFGCNNLNGTPKGHVQVYVYATQNKNETSISNSYTKGTAKEGELDANVTSRYDVAAVYGGGNLSPYVPADALLDYETNKATVDAARCEVHIEGCDVTSIKQVYGGGNAAAASATLVEVNSCYEIDEVFGGGNGYDNYSLGTVWYENPGANVGYYNFTTYPKTGTNAGSGVQGDPWKAVVDAAASDKDHRLANTDIQYGSGIARTEINGGKIHIVYGGSNLRGNVRTKMSSVYSGMSGCTMDIDESYGNGNQAESDGEVEMISDCAKGVREMFGGAKDADVNNDINLIITNGSSLERVFGGNNTSGAINGSITVTIKEGGCEPIRIGELYLGGYLAPYSVYGYKKTGDEYDVEENVPYIDGNETKYHDQRIPLRAGENGALETPYKDPCIYVISATSIGSIYGGGYQAAVVGNPHVNVNMEPGKVMVTKTEITDNESHPFAFKDSEDGKNYVYKDADGTEYDPATVNDSYATLEVGTIGNIYGGGNMADIIGNTYVEIGTGTWHNADGVLETEDANGNKYTYKKDANNEWHWYNASNVVQTTAPIPGRNAAKITGNVYGGGNLGDVGKYHMAPDPADNSKQIEVFDGTDANGRPDVRGNTYVSIGTNYAAATGQANLTIDGNVFGGGRGEDDTFTCEKAMVTGGTNVSIVNGTIGDGTAGNGNVYGGGEIGRVEQHTVVAIGAGTGDAEGTPAPVIVGNVFGAGAGVETHGYSALVRGNTQVTVQGNAKVEKNIYGGGMIAAVGKYGLDSSGMPSTLKGGGECEVTVMGYAKIGPDNGGHVFGAGMGVDESKKTYNYEDNANRPKRMMTYASGLYTETNQALWEYTDATDHTYVWEYFPTREKYLDFLQTLALATDTEVTIDDHAFVNGNVYGGSESGFVQRNTDVSIQGTCTIGTANTAGNVFGGGKGLSGFDKAGRVRGNTTLAVSGGTITGNVYGGGELGYVGKFTTEDHKEYTWYEIKDKEDHDITTGLCTVTITGGKIGLDNNSDNKKGNVFGAGKGMDDTFECEQAMARTTSVSISDGTVNGNVYGGGEVGRVDQHTVVTIGDGANDGAGVANATTPAPEIIGSVFGAGAGVETHGYSALVRGNATVTIQGNASVGHSVYGGGMIASVGQYGLDSNFMPETLKSGGDCKVTVKGYSVIGSSGVGNVFGAGMGVNPFDNDHKYIDYSTDSTDKETKPKRMTKKPDPDKMPALYTEIPGTNLIWEYYTSQADYFKFLQTLALATDSYATIEGNATVNGNVYGGSESGFVQRETNVNIKGSCKILTVTDTENNTTTDGNVFGGGKGVSGFDKAGRVRGNATTTISESSTVHGNVYGGGEFGFVGKFTVSADGRDYTWQKITNQEEEEEETGTCTVTINSATAEVKGNVFGAGKGKDDTFKCEQAMVKETSVAISAGTVNGSVYGGGEVGRVDQNTAVTIGDEGADKTGAGSATGADAPVIGGSVFGAGAGVETHGYSALVRGNTEVTVQGNAKVGESVYGGGMIASVGKYALDKFQMPSILNGGGECTVLIKGYAKIGPDDGGNVFGAGRGVTPHFVASGDDRSKRMMTYSEGFVTGKVQGTDWDYYTPDHTYIWDYLTTEDDYNTYLETLALATKPDVTITGNASVNGDVYGGGERGITKGSVSVTINGGTIARDVYGGGALANTNISNWTKYEGETDTDPAYWSWTDNTKKTAKYTTTVNLHGGTIGHNVYGGGLGQKHKEAVAAEAAQGTEGQEGYVPAVEAQDEVPAIAALVYGDVLVKLNETPTVTEGVANFPDNCVVKGVIHGANNYNGSPLGDVTVHVYKTQGWSGHDVTEGKNDDTIDKDDSMYELKAVYGGGNEATYDTEGYYPFTDAINAKREAHVIIDGCNLTSIQTVYGGGNAAAAPATHVEVNGCYEIGTVFAGGNGADAMSDGSENPGADVGYKPNAAGTGKVSYGTGEALAEIHGGFVHSAFGGSNTKGNVRESATVQLSEFDTSDSRYCSLGIDEAYGAGNEAEQDGTSNIDLGCLSYLRELYGGAKNADVNNDIVLNVQSGRFHRVFGGNNIGGRINGTITVNVEETGCHPIIIGQLFGGGNQAGYSVYGYKPELKGDGTIKTDANGKTCWLPFKKNDAAVTVEGVTYSPKTETTKFNDPVVNVRSFTSIGEIYGGGYGNSAVIVGNPTVDINECLGSHADDAATENFIDQEGHPVVENNQPVKVSENTGKWIHIKVGASEYNTVWQPEHKEGAIGTIGNVFGGGNAAPVEGNTNVYIGTKESVVFATPKKKTVTTNDVTTEVDTTVEDRTHTVKGANITGNVYGGGNAADVSGDTNVVIGKGTTTTSGGSGGSGGN